MNFIFIQWEQGYFFLSKKKRFHFRVYAENVCKYLNKLLDPKKV